jgi:hypothetical protein
MKLILLSLGLLLALGNVARAAEGASDPTGTWHWTAPANPDGQVPKVTFNLKLQGDILTGTVVKATGTKNITNGVVKGDQVSFQVFSAGHAGKSVATYSGKLTQDVIKGNVEIEVADKKFSTAWEVRRD